MEYIILDAMSFEVQNLNFSHDNSFLIKDLSFIINNKEIGYVVGDSGSGKSSLFNIIAGLIKPNSGEIICNGVYFNNPTTFLAPENRNIGYVFQDFGLFPHINVKKNITYAAIKDEKYLDNLLKSLNLKEHIEKMPFELSGGQQQRVSIARAIMRNPSLLILDEPFSNLDTVNTNNVIKLITNEINLMEIPCLIATHDHARLESFDKVKKVIL